MRREVRMAERAAGTERQPVTPPFDQTRMQEVLDAAAAFTRRMALSIATMPPEARSAALALTERAIRASKCSANPRSAINGCRRP